MRKILIIFLIAIINIVFSSCTKENENVNVVIEENSIADKFIGSYSVYCSSVAYGNSMIDVDSLLVITKISDCEIKTSGYFNTFGIIADTNYICFEPISYNSSQEVSSIEFTIGTLDGNILTFSAIGHYMFGWNGPGGIMNGDTRNHYFTAYKN